MSKRGTHKQLADGELHSHDHGVEAEHIIFSLQGDAIGRILVRVHLVMSA